MRGINMSNKTKLRERDIALVKALKQRLDAIEKQDKALRAVLGNTHESALGDAIDRLISLAVKAVSAAIGDTEEWLPWYIWDNEWGKRSRPRVCNNKIKTIKRITDLLWLIDEGKRIDTERAI